MTLAQELTDYVYHYVCQHGHVPKLIPITPDEYWQLREQNPAPQDIQGYDGSKFRGVALQLNQKAKERRETYERVLPYR